MPPAKFGALFLIALMVFIFAIEPVGGLVVFIFSLPVWVLFFHAFTDKDMDWEVRDGSDWYNHGGHGKV